MVTSLVCLTFQKKKNKNDFQSRICTILPTMFEGFNFTAPLLVWDFMFWGCGYHSRYFIVIWFAFPYI